MNTLSAPPQGAPRRRRPFLFALLTLGALAAAVLPLQPVLAQEQESDDEPAPVGIATIRSRLALLATYPEAGRAEAEALYKAALSDLERAARDTAKRDELRRALEAAPARLEEARARLGTTPAAPELGEAKTLRVTEQRRAEAAATLEGARSRLGALEAEAARRSKRLPEIAQESAEVQSTLSALRAEQTDPSLAADSNSLLAAAGPSAKYARLQALAARRDLLEVEGASYDARRELLAARTDVARREVDAATRALELWREEEARRRRVQADQAVADAAQIRRESAGASPELIELAAGNHELASLRAGEDGLSGRLEAATAELEKRRAELARVYDSSRAVHRKVEAAGLTRAMGRLLRLQLDLLPDLDALERQAAAQAERISDVQFELILREEERARAGDPEQQLAELLRQIPPSDRAEAEPVARLILTERRELLDALLEDESRLLDRLVGLRQTTQELIRATSVYKTYIEERILWVRSVSQTPFEALPQAGPALVWLGFSSEWPPALRATAAEAWSRLGWTSALLCGLVLLGGCAWSARARLKHLSLDAWDERASTLKTLEGLAHCFLISAPLPALLLTAGHLLSAPPNQLEVARAWAGGLGAAAGILYVLLVLIRLSSADGIGAAHFRWRSQVMAHVRWHLRWFAPLAAVTTFLITTLDRQSTTAYNDSLGLLAFVVQMIALSVLVGLVMRPSGPLVSTFLQRHGEGWLARLRYFWLTAVIGLPAALAILALLGFHSSGLILFRRLESTLLVVLGLMLLSSLLDRWLALIRLRLARESARRREEAKQQEAARLAAGGEEGEEAAPPPPAPTHQPGALSARARSLFASALGVTLLLSLYAVWADVLPALRRLDRVQIYPTFQLLPPPAEAPILGPQQTTIRPSSGDGTSAAGAPHPATKPEPGADSSANSESPEQAPSPSLPGPLPATSGKSPNDASGSEPSAHPAQTRVTLADLGLSFLLLILTILVAKNLPALIEIVILEQLPIDRGLRFAIVTVATYGIAMIGGAATLSAAGIGWANVQWLAAALTFGLAFGLQEIFANFVSGLIILFERPIRVGDAVTVGGVSGTVTRLQMRATTVTDWDNKELIIPNKEFVTGQVINWSLSSPHVRVCLPVGVAYGSDLRRTRELLLSIASEHVEVLKEPAPTAFFTGFGDSSLDFELRVFIPHPKHRWDVQHALLQAINDAFVAEGIEVPFPQRDLHLDAEAVAALSGGRAGVAAERGKAASPPEAAVADGIAQIDPRIEGTSSSSSPTAEGNERRD